MSYIKIIPTIYLKDEKAYLDKTFTGEGYNPVEICENYSDNGADEILIMDMSDSDATHEKNILIMKEIADAVDVPMLIGGNVKRLEDVKKYIYAGGQVAVLDMNKESNVEMIKEASDRFGKENIAVMADKDTDVSVLYEAKDKGAYFIIADGELTNLDIAKTGLKVLAKESDVEPEYLYGISNVDLSEIGFDIMDLKNAYKLEGFEVNMFESSMHFSDFKLNSDGHIPVIVQDYKTDEVLMLAYMNEEAFNKTIETGKMTYYSRSRDELWIKGLTSGHFQYVKSLTLDCDNDTILAKVKQIGAACHTGNRTCFFNTLVKKEYDETNPLKVFEDVFNVILDRKENPKEGSYTNYLFDKGIDKILKKLGEEATEIVIAAKNPDPEEIKYEMSDFLYHAMVLMAEKGVSWEDITKELARR
ncbi:MAG: bifunctional phosphoribosyl-AMP cyclohydrolase/phosphoribosyl-ATP diphosphatase HisIE [Lachnospiraceae bacterium]|nr:bifunctional phosphoribosyl-AMP cyclohydrolase/phosphoribosyl-ATP diphosphatase HisIE [Lachnospiraceae bacterium]MBQ4068940.1 bifunctional phosphoribosyl-AMP cyclohydrolase/phosphoribosyl-ATP diphosphatase HisIE [Lachnospiraceae bacterium]